MERNLSWRVEVVVPVIAPALRQRLWEILEINLSDRRQAWVMAASGEYQRLEPGPEARGPEVDGTQSTLMRLAATTALTSDGNAVVQELPIHHGPELDFTNSENSASLAAVALESKRT
jgi:hypothetical protein